MRCGSCATCSDHFLRGYQKLFHVQAHDRGGHHAEIRKRRIAPSDAWHTEKDFTEFFGYGGLLQLRAGIGDGDEAVPNLFLAHFSFHSLEEILLVNVGFQRAARFARDDAKRALEVHFLFDRLDLHRIRGVQHVKFGKTFDLPESHAQDFRAKAGSAHS